MALGLVHANVLRQEPTLARVGAIASEVVDQLIRVVPDRLDLAGVQMEGSSSSRSCQFRPQAVESPLEGG